MTRLLFLIFTFLFFVQPAQALKSIVTIEDEPININMPWTRVALTTEKNIQKLISYLAKSKTGRLILKKAKARAAKQGKTLEDILIISDVSLTDTTLIRKFSASNPKNVVYESRSVVHINRDLRFIDAILDLAHELTHYTYRDAFNPYQGEFSLVNFITSTIEGRGGEVDAYLVECYVYRDLFPRKLKSNSKCLSVYDEKRGRFSKVKGVKQFYRLGEYYNEFKKRLSEMLLDSKEFPYANNANSLFISSAYSVPYPLAATFEYLNIMGRACKNDKKRIGLMKIQTERQAGLKRSPASIRNIEGDFARLNNSYFKRCSQFIN